MNTSTFMRYLLIGLVACVVACQADHLCDRSCDNSQPMTCEYEFKLEWYSTMSKACFNCPLNVSDCFREDCIAADGVSRAVTVVNRGFPGPTITVCHNDTISVRVENALENNEGTAIHWHGLYQRDTPWMDGVPQVTQCPIPAGTSFVYTFKADPPGTHWWHAHAGFQRADGVAGAIVIKTPTTNNPHVHLYDVDNETYTVLIGDWLHQTTMSKYIQHHHADGNNKGEAILINGRGRYRATGNDTCTSADGDPVNGNVTSSSPLTEFPVDKGLRYRFRIISNAAVFCPFELTFDAHVITVIATDGIDVTPLNVSSLVVHGGERFDVVIAANQKPGYYRMHVQGMADCSNNSQEALLRYTSAENDSIITSFPPLSTNVMQLNPLNRAESNETKYVTYLTPVHRYDDVVGDPDDVIYIGFDFKKVNNPKYHHPDLYPLDLVSTNKHLYTPQLNNVSWHSPPSPLLTQANDVNSSQICNTHAENDVTNNTFRACSHVIDLPLGRLVDLVVFDEGYTFDAGHPMHLHGQHFSVVAMDKVGSNISLDQIKNLVESDSIQYNPDPASAVKKDTVIIPDGGYAILRFYTSNPGVWLFHCHLSFHIEAGMTMAFRVGDVTSDVKGTPQNFPRCGNWPGFETCSVECEKGNSAAKPRLATWFLLVLTAFATLMRIH